MNASPRRLFPMFFAAAIGATIPPAFARDHEGCDGGKSCPHHEGKGHGGGEGRGSRLGLHHLLEGVDLRADQRDAVMQLHKEAMADRSTLEATTKAYRDELAKGVRSGSFDSATLDKLLAKTADDLAALPPVHVKMLARLHAILDKNQRAQVAEKIAAMQPMGMHGGDPGDAADKPDKRGRGDAGAVGKHGRGGREHRRGGPGMHRFERFAEELELSRAQREAIFKAFRDRMRADHANGPRSAMHHEMQKRHQALAERFRAETFTVTEADRIPAALAGKRIAQLTTFAVIATPELTVNQRLKFADHIEAGRTDDEP